MKVGLSANTGLFLHVKAPSGEEVMSKRSQHHHWKETCVQGINLPSNQAVEVESSTDII